MKQAVIFAGAPVQPEQQPPVPAADLYVCADAGVKLAQALGVVPDWIVGDFDSLGSVPGGGKCGTVFPHERRYGYSAGGEVCAFQGAAGGWCFTVRWAADWITLWQIFRCSAFWQTTAHRVCWLTMPTGSHSSVAERQFYPRRDGMYFSLFAMTEQCEDVTLEGVAYPLCHGSFPMRFRWVSAMRSWQKMQW